jgi:hypothetical protein
MTDSLVRMANQIALSVPDQALAAEQTAAHLKAFWTPSMIDELTREVARDPECVNSTVKQALADLRPEALNG